MNEEQQRIKKQNIELLKQLPKHAKTLKEFHHRHRQNFDLVGEITPAEENRNFIHSYREWLDYNEQHYTVVEDIMQRLKHSPTNWLIDFDLLTEDGRRQFFPLLRDFLLNEIGQLIITDDYRIRYRVNNEWRTTALTPEVFDDLMESFTQEDFIFDFDSTPPEYFYDRQSMQMPAWSLFSAIKFEPIKKVKSNNDRGGNFFKYVTDNLPSIVVEYLKRLQIFDKLDDDNKRREELNDCCFVYALKQTGEYSEEILNQIRLRINTRYLSNSAVANLCKEFKIHLKLNYIDVNSRRIEHKKKRYFGVCEEKAAHRHLFNIYNKHYFIEERTPFTRYYIENVDF